MSEIAVPDVEEHADSFGRYWAWWCRRPGCRQVVLLDTDRVELGRRVYRHPGACEGISDASQGRGEGS